MLREIKRVSIKSSAGILYILALLLKLVYFNSQIGGDSFNINLSFASLGSLLVLVSISFLLKPISAAIYRIALNLLLTVGIFSNVVFYRYFNDLISIPLLFQAGNLSDVSSSMLQLLHWSDLLLIIDFLFIPVLNKSIGIRFRAETKVGGKLLRAAACCIAGIIIVLFSFGQLMKSQPTILQTFYDRVYVAQNIGLLNYQAADVYTFMVQNMNEDSELSLEKQKEIMKFFEDKGKSSNQPGELFGIGKDKNVIVIQVEALQQFVINKKVNGQEITPNLNKLISKSIYFDNYYYQTAGGGTSDAEFTTNVSMYPMQEGSVYIRKPGNYYYSLPQKLKDNGYGTIAMHGYKPGFWNRSVMYKTLGFDEFFSKESIKQDKIIGMGIGDKSFLDQAFDKLNKNKQPYFAFIITLTSHFPYDNDKSAYSRFDVGEYKDTLIGNYLEAIHYTDEALGMFVEELHGSGLLDNTVLAVYGDHHAIPKDNMKELAGFMGKESLNELEWQQLQKVPMIIHLPDSEEPRIISTAGGGTDFTPTLLHLAGIDTSNMAYMGRDLLNSKEGFVVFRNGSFVTDSVAYISSSNAAYDIKTGEALAPESYEEAKLMAEKYLDYSDTILEFDLIDDIKQYLEAEK